MSHGLEVYGTPGSPDQALGTLYSSSPEAYLLPKGSEVQILFSQTPLSNLLTLQEMSECPQHGEQQEVTPECNLGFSMVCYYQHHVLWVVVRTGLTRPLGFSIFNIFSKAVSSSVHSRGCSSIT